MHGVNMTLDIQRLLNNNLYFKKYMHVVGMILEVKIWMFIINTQKDGFNHYT